MYNDDFLDAKRLVCDPPADAFIKHVFADPAKKQQLQQWMGGKSSLPHLGSLQSAFPGVDFIHSAAQLPSWAQPRLMEAGSVFFARHSVFIMRLLGLLSLPYCYTAANGAMVLYQSGLIKQQTTKRLFDTAIFVWQVLAPGAFGKDGNAFEEILKVRIMHAAVRYYTLQAPNWHPDWGAPINQEDMAGTNLSFSFIVIRGLRLLGFRVSPAEEAAFIHTWAVVGYLTGLNEDLIPGNAAAAQQLDDAIKQRHFRVSAHGQELTAALIDHILKVNTSKATPNDIMGMMRYLLGSEIADMLAINAPELPAWKVGLIKTINLLKSFKPRGDSTRQYHDAYTAFTARSAAFSQD